MTTENVPAIVDNGFQVSMLSAARDIESRLNSGDALSTNDKLALLALSRMVTRMIAGLA